MGAQKIGAGLEVNLEELVEENGKAPAPESAKVAPAPPKTEAG